MLDTLMEGGNLYTTALYLAAGYLRFNREQLEAEKDFFLEPLSAVEVEGYVIDQKTRELLNGVKVELRYGSPNGELIETKSIISGGKFGFYDLPFRKGSYYVRYSKEGYDTAVHAFSMIEKNTKHYDCRTCELRPIEIAATPSPTPGVNVMANTTVVPTATPKATPSPKATASPEVTPSPLVEPTPKGTPTPTNTPTNMPTVTPTVAPTIKVTATPVFAPTPQATPGVETTTAPTVAPTVHPIVSPAIM